MHGRRVSAVWSRNWESALYLGFWFKLYDRGDQKDDQPDTILPCIIKLWILLQNLALGYRFVVYESIEWSKYYSLFIEPVTPLHIVFLIDICLYVQNTQEADASEDIISYFKMHMVASSRLHFFIACISRPSSKLVMYTWSYLTVQ